MGKGMGWFKDSSSTRSVSAHLYVKKLFFSATEWRDTFIGDYIFFNESKSV